jgi:hypothetical protein
LQGPFYLDVESKPHEISNISALTSFTPSETEGFMDLDHKALITFDDFAAAYEYYIGQRMIPKSKCDILDPRDYEVALDPKTGMVFARFFVMYEDNICLPLRFFQPPSTPGVEKKKKSYRTGMSGFGVQGAFGLKYDQGKILLDAAYIFSSEGDKVVKKLAKHPLQGFLQTPDFSELILFTLQSMQAKTTMPEESYNITSMKMTQNKQGKIQMSLGMKGRVHEDNACALYDKLNSAKGWRPK